MKYYIPDKSMFNDWDLFVRSTGYRPGDKYVIREDGNGYRFRSRIKHSYLNIRTNLYQELLDDRMVVYRTSRSHLPTWW